MTEEEAKTKWCPMARIFTSTGDLSLGCAGAAGNIGTEHGEPPHCIGSECMMWRAIMGHGTEFEPPKQLGGYCGLAGKP